MVKDMEEGPVNEGALGEVEDMERGGDLAVLREQLAQLEDERNALREEVARARADFYNFRQRSEREGLRQRELAAERAVTLLLPVLDNLDRAMESSGGGEGLRQGVAMVRRLFFEALQELGVSLVEAEGAFDPARHDAVGTVPVKDPAQDHLVIDVIRPGYALGGRVLRPAMVRVGAHTPASDGGSR